ncbi:MAG: DUF2953 domain-containing protein [Ruminococcaceae bacterium]|nr:DUF2953 domain-containing protein [Oscillospiraceae bacterium]
MAILITVGIILLLLVALLFVRIKFDIILEGDILVRLNVLGIKIPLYPAKEKKIKTKKFKKGYPKEKESSKKKASPPKKEPAPSDEKIPLGDKISTILSLIKLLFSRFFKHLRLDISKIIVVVGSNDAATTAISYGIISQSVAYLLEFLDNNLNISQKRNGEINVLCDFTAENTVYDVFISASLNIWQILDIGISLVYNYFKGKDIFNIKKLFLGGQKNHGRKQDQ